jgi:hypothetical protein
MKALVFFVVALSGLACVRAQFSPVEGKDSSVPDRSAPKKDASSCPAPNKCSAQPAGGAPCDPVCQTGTCDWCSEKCSIAGDGTTTCSAKGEGDALSGCNISKPGTDLQYDDCAPGNICLPAGGTGYSYCFKHCGSSADCIGAPCLLRSLTTKTGSTALQVRVCDPPYSPCNDAVPGNCCDPVSKTGSGCRDDQTCYLVPPSPNTPDPKALDNLTVCDFTEKIGTKRARCSSVRDCAEGWSCNSTLLCQQVCVPNDTSNPCPDGGICTAVGKQYGFCP